MLESFGSFTKEYFFPVATVNLKYAGKGIDFIDMIQVFWPMEIFHQPYYQIFGSHKSRLQEVCVRGRSFFIIIIITENVLWTYEYIHYFTLLYVCSNISVRQEPSSLCILLGAV